MPADEKDQVINEMKASPTPMFSFPVDLQQMLLQMLAFVRHILSADIKEEFLFCKELQAITTSADVSEKIKTCFVFAELQWKYVCV